jgi:hypothetical protein
MAYVSGNSCGSVATMGGETQPEKPSGTVKPVDRAVMLKTGGSGTGMSVTFTIVETAVDGSRFDIADTLIQRGDGLGTFESTIDAACKPQLASG